MTSGGEIVPVDFQRADAEYLQWQDDVVELAISLALSYGEDHRLSLAAAETFMFSMFNRVLGGAMEGGEGLLLSIDHIEGIVGEALDEREGFIDQMYKEVKQLRVDRFGGARDLGVSEELVKAAESELHSGVVWAKVDLFDLETLSSVVNINQGLVNQLSVDLVERETGSKIGRQMREVLMSSSKTQADILRGLMASEMTIQVTGNELDPMYMSHVDLDDLVEAGEYFDKRVCQRSASRLVEQYFELGDEGRDWAVNLLVNFGGQVQTAVRNWLRSSAYRDSDPEDIDYYVSLFRFFEDLPLEPLTPGRQMEFVAENLPQALEEGRQHIWQSAEVLEDGWAIPSRKSLVGALGFLKAANRGEAMEVRNIEGALSAWNNYEKEMRRLPREIVEAQERAERVALDIIDGVGAEVDLRMERFFKTQVSKFSRQVKYFGEGIEANELLGEHLMAIEVGGDSDVDFAREKFVRGVRQLYLSKLGNIVRGFDSRLARRQRGLSRLGWWAFGLDIGGGGYEFELETLDEVNDEIEICERWLDELDQGAMLPAEISGDPGKLRLFLEQWKKRFNMGHGRKYLSRPEIKAMPALFVGGINMALDGNVDWHEFGPWVRRETEARLETLVDVRGLMEDADRYRNIVNQTSILLNVDEVKGREFEYEHNEDAWRIIEDELELGVQVKQWNTLRASHLPAEVYEQLDRLGNDVTEVEEIFEIRRGMIGGLQVEFESIDDLQAQLKERINILESERKEHQTTYRLLKAINETIGKNRIMPWKEFETGGRLSSVMKAVNQRMKVIRAIDLLDETQDSLDFASQRLDEHSENARSFRARVAYNQYVELIKDLDSQYARNVVDFIEKMRQEGLLVDASLLD